MTSTYETDTSAPTTGDGLLTEVRSALELGYRHEADAITHVELLLAEVMQLRAELARREPATTAQPWGGGENPAPGQWVWVRLRSGYANTNNSDRLRWDHWSNSGDIVLWRLATEDER